MKRQTGAETQDEKLDFSVVIPVYNEQDNLRELYERLSRVMSGLDSPYEIIISDDGSNDGSFELLKELHHQDGRLKVIRLFRNFGQAAAISAGLQACSGKYVIVLDADLQHPPEEIPKLIREMEQGYDIVYGLRRHRKDSLYRRAGSKLLYWYMTKFMGIKLPEGTSAFRVMNRKMVAYFNELPERTRFFGALASWLGAKYTCIDIEHAPRKKGKSGYSFFRLLRISLNLALAFSAIPLRLIGIFGILVALAGFSLGLYVLINKVFFGIGVPGYPSIILVITFFSGVILISLSIVGEYIKRIYTQIQGRPTYFVRETLGFNTKE